MEELELPNVWLVGQAVKTSASHAENRGSIPLSGTTNVGFIILRFFVITTFVENKVTKSEHTA